MTEPLVLISNAGAVRTLSLNRPAALNSFTTGLHAELLAALEAAAADSSVRCVVLTGAGRAFSAGGDLKGMLRATEDAAFRHHMTARAPHLLRSVLALDKPTIARVNGHAMGLGATLALLCDVVFMAEDARIADPHVNVGLSAGDGGSLVWPHLIGYARARHHLLTGEALTGTEAERIGLIHKALPLTELDATVDAYADRLANGPQLALRATKRSINMALCAQAATAADAHLGLELMTMSSADHREAVAALLEKRAPRFGGR